jgi:hypothetical protein
VPGHSEEGRTGDRKFKLEEFAAMSNRKIDRRDRIEGNTAERAFLILSDIHSYLEALHAVLEDAAGVAKESIVRETWSATPNVHSIMPEPLPMLWSL